MATSIAEILNVRLPAQIFAYSRKRLGILNAASKNFSTDPGQKGAIIPWGVARGVSAVPVVPGPYRATTSNLAQDAAGITLSNYNAVPLVWTDTNQMFQQIEQTEAPAIVEAANAIADGVSQSIWTAIAASYPQNYVGTVGTAFTYAFFQALSAQADNQRFSPANRVIVANSSNILDIGKDDILKYYFAFNQNTEMFAKGLPMEILEWKVQKDINQPTVQVVGDGANYALDADYAVGVKTIVTRTGTTAGGSAFVVGDLITLGHGGGGAVDTNVYQIVSVSGATTTWTLGLSTPTTSSASAAGAANSGGSVTSYVPANGGLLVAHKATDAITIVATARGGTGGMSNALAVNGQGPVAFDPLGVVNAMRMPPAVVLGREMLAEPAFVKDEVTGMPLAIYAYREYHQICVEVCYINGVGVRSELVIPILR